MSLSAKTLRSGGVIAFPTDTVYGIGAIFYKSDSVAQLYKIKSRPHNKAIPILIGNKNQLDSIAKNISLTSKQLMKLYWPGPLTIIMQKQDTVDSIVSSSNTVAVRMPNFDWLRDLISLVGPLAVTSANKSSEPAAITYNEVQRSIGDDVDLIVKNDVFSLSTNSFSQASTVVDCSIEPPITLREGPISNLDIIENI